MKRPGTSDSKAIDDPVSRLAFPVLTFCNNGCLNLKFRARRKDLERTTTFEVKVGLFPTSERDAARDQGGDFRRGLDRHSRAVRMVGHFAARMVIPTRSPNLTQRARRPQSQNLMPENNMQTFPLPLCQGIRGFSVTKQKALAKAAVFALMKRSAIG